MIIIKWENLPKKMQTPDVKKYYDILKKKKFSLVIKRVFDIVVSLFMLVVLFPFYFIIALCIKLDSKGSVIFKQKRVTQNGREFEILKFRTMIENAENFGGQVTLDEDTRITKVGKLLRKYRIDETPQLINVLKGEMSFVGTRPEVKKYVDKYTPKMLATLLLPAGVTSEASIRCKDEAKLLKKEANVDQLYIKEVMPEKMKYNLEYIEKFSFWNDIKLMFLTVVKIFNV